MPEKIRQFRDNRLGRIAAGDAPALNEEGAKTILHVLPILALEPTANINIEKLEEANLEPLNSGSRSSRYNLDGVLIYCPTGKGKCIFYVQFFRTGAIETVETALLHAYEGRQVISGTVFEHETIKALRSYLAALKKLELAVPAFVMLTLMGVKGYWMASKEHGKILHEVLAAFFRNGGDPVEVFASLWKQAGQVELDYGPKESWEKLETIGRNLLGRFVEKELTKLDAVRGIEKPFTLKVTSLDLPIIGVIDLVAKFEGKVTVIDFKSSPSSYQDHEAILSDQLAEPEVEQTALCVFINLGGHVKTGQ